MVGSMNELTIYERIADPVQAVKFFGQAISKSGMFGVTGDKQGEVLAWECLVRRQAPLTLAETYHVIHGRLSMKADKMLANFNDAGGKHKIIDRNPDLAAVQLTMDGDTRTFSMSWVDAQSEPFIYNGKESDVVKLLLGSDSDRAKLKIKDKYSTPRARMQMLWARVISDGVRAIFPSANSGRYTPEEIDDDDLPPVSPASRSQVVESEVVTETETAAVADENAVEGQDAEATQSQTSPDGFATGAQSVQLNDLYAALALSADQIEKALKKRGAANNRGLKFEAAAELLDTLTAALAKKQLTAAEVETAAAEVAGESRQNPDNVTNHPAGPATPEQIEQAKALLKELNQVSPAQFNRWKAHMDSKQLKIADLSTSECSVLLGDLQTKTLAAFFDLSLQGWKPKDSSPKN